MKKKVYFGVALLIIAITLLASSSAPKLLEKPLHSIAVCQDYDSWFDQLR